MRLARLASAAIVFAGLFSNSGAFGLAVAQADGSEFFGPTPPEPAHRSEENARAEYEARRAALIAAIEETSGSAHDRCEQLLRLVEICDAPYPPLPVTEQLVLSSGDECAEAVLAEMGDERVIAHLVEQTKRGGENYAALEAAGPAASGATQTLVDRYPHAKGRTQAAIFAALMVMQDARALPVLVEKMYDDGDRGLDVIEAIGMIGPAANSRSLRARLGGGVQWGRRLSDDEQVQEVAREALARITGKEPVPPRNRRWDRVFLYEGRVYFVTAGHFTAR